MSLALLAQPAVSLLADDDTDKGSPIGLFVVLALIIAVYFLYRSMNRHMRNLPDSFDPPQSFDPSQADAEMASEDPPVPLGDAEQVDEPAGDAPELTKRDSSL